MSAVPLPVIVPCPRPAMALEALEPSAGGLTEEPRGLLLDIAQACAATHPVVDSAATPESLAARMADEEAARFAYGHVVALLLSRAARSGDIAALRAPASSSSSGSSDPFACLANRLPSISIADYVKRIMRYTPATKEMFVVALLYVDRVLQLNPGIVLSLRNAHRLFIASVVVASKFLDDMFFSNQYLSSVAGLSPQYLNALELHFLKAVKFDLNLNPAVYEEYRTWFHHLALLAAEHGDLTNFFHGMETIPRRAAMVVADSPRVPASDEENDGCGRKRTYEESRTPSPALAPPTQYRRTVGEGAMYM